MALNFEQLYFWGVNDRYLKCESIDFFNVSVNSKGYHRPSQGSICWGGEGGSFPPNVSASPPKVFLKKNLKLFQIKIFFDDDFKESVKVTMSRNAISANPDPPNRPKNIFSRCRVAQRIFFQDRLPPKTKNAR